jgi:hypothetical protein
MFVTSSMNNVFLDLKNRWILKVIQRKFEVLTAVKIPDFFWVVTLYGLAGRYQSFSDITRRQTST